MSCMTAFLPEPLGHSNWAQWRWHTPTRCDNPGAMTNFFLQDRFSSPPVPPLWVWTASATATTTTNATTTNATTTNATTTNATTTSGITTNATATNATTTNTTNTNATPPSRPPPSLPPPSLPPPSRPPPSRPPPSRRPRPQTPPPWPCMGAKTKQQQKIRNQPRQVVVPVTKGRGPCTVKLTRTVCRYADHLLETFSILDSARFTTFNATTKPLDYAFAMSEERSSAKVSCAFTL